MWLTGLPLYSVLLLCIGFLASCGIPIQPVPPPIKTLETSTEYLKEGKLHFDSGRFVEAQRYLLEAIRLDPNNQPARVLAGVTWAKLGKASNARREFERAVEIHKDTADGETAQAWLKRLEQPLPLAIFPFENIAKNSGYGVERLSYQALYRQLFESGLYSIIDERQLGFGSSRKGSRQSQACQVAREKGARIAMLGIIGDFQLVQDKPPPLYLGERVNTFYAAALKVSLQVYETENCRSVNTFTKSAVKRQIPDRTRDVALQQIVDSVFQQLALNIHATLM